MGPVPSRFSARKVRKFFQASSQRTFVIFTMLIVLLSLPLTILVLQQRQTVKQQAATSDAPFVDTITITPNAPAPSQSMAVHVTGSPNTTFRIYIHSYPTDNDPTNDAVVQSYNPNTIAPNTFYYIGTNDTPFKAPSTPGTYSIAVNAVIGSYTCAWNSLLFQGTPGGSYTNTGTVCTNRGLRPFTVAQGSDVITGTLNYPFVTSISPVSALAGAPLTVTATGKADTFRTYIYGGASKPTQSLASSANPYNPDSVDANFYFLGNSPAKVAAAPTEPRQYWLVVNGESKSFVGTIGCAWNKATYTRNSDGTVTFNGGTCSNSGPQALQVSYPSVASVSATPSQLNPGGKIQVSVSGKATKYWLYVYQSSTGAPPDGNAAPDPSKVVQTYNPTTMKPDTFYKFGMVSGAITAVSLQLPATNGVYYVVANGHSRAEETIPWHKYDRTCAWSGKVYKYDTSPVSQVTEVGVCGNTISAPVIVGTPSTVPSVTLSPSPSEKPSTAPSGVTSPTASVSPSSTPNGTPLDFTVKLHGIGSAGDSLNPSGSGNQNPLHTTRKLAVWVFDNEKEQIAQGSGEIVYDSPSGTFKGTITMETAIPSGSYTVKVKTDSYLSGLLPGTSQAITDTGANTLVSVALVAGDVNGDDALDILDYNILIGCYSDLTPAQACTPEQKIAADLNDDGKTNQRDYNLMLREFAGQNSP